MSKRAKKKKIKHQADQATPETRRKLKRGTLAYMIEKGDISATGPEMMAADEIACAYSYQVHGQTTRVQSYERQDRSFNQNEPVLQHHEELRLDQLRRRRNGARNLCPCAPRCQHRSCAWRQGGRADTLRCP